MQNAPQDAMTVVDLGSLEWLNPPANSRADSNALKILTRPRTDFWQRTHYGFRRDDGHFLFARNAEDFAMEVSVSLSPSAMYDQAGLMVRCSPSCWLKTSCEFQPSQPSQLGAVVTNAGYSDWSYRPIDAYPDMVRFRIERHAGNYLLSAQLGGDAMSVHRVAHLLEDDGRGDVMAGLYACSPDGDGCDVTFTDFSLGRIGDSGASGDG